MNKVRNQVLRDIIKLHRKMQVPIENPRIQIYDRYCYCYFNYRRNHTEPEGVCSGYRYRGGRTISSHLSHRVHLLGAFTFKRLHYWSLNIFTVMTTPEICCPKHRLKLFKEIRKALKGMSTNELILKYNEHLSGC